MSAATNITGQWTGTITYGKGYGRLAGRELYFAVDMVQYGHEIAGRAIDTGGFGMSRDAANLLGSFFNDRIYFLKQYESLHYITQNETKTDRSQKGPQIRYSGVFDPANKTFSGTWVIRLTLRLFGLLPIPVKQQGTWTMRLK